MSQVITYLIRGLCATAVFMVSTTTLSGQNVGVGISLPLRPLHTYQGHLITQGGHMSSNLDTSAFTIIDEFDWKMSFDGNEIQVYNPLISENAATMFLQPFSGDVIIGRRLGIGTAVGSTFELDVAGQLNLNKNIGTAPALFVNGAEALWYNGTYFSWGFGGTANFFSDDIGIGVSEPSARLHVVGDAIITDLGVSGGGNVRSNASGGLESIEEVYAVNPATFDCYLGWSGGGVLGGVSHGYRADGLIVSGRNGDDDCPIMVAGLSLTHGDEINRLAVYAIDGTSAKSLKVQLFRKTHGLSDATLLTEITTPKTSFLNPLIATFNNHIVNNREYSYYLKAFSYDQDGDQNTVVQWPPEIEIRAVYIE